MKNTHSLCFYIQLFLQFSLYCSQKGKGYGSLKDYNFSCVDCLPSHKLSYGLSRWKW